MSESAEEAGRYCDAAAGGARDKCEGLRSADHKRVCKGEFADVSGALAVAFGDPEEDADEDEHSAHDEWTAEGSFDIVLELETDQTCGDGGEHEIPEETWRLFEFRIVSVIETQGLGGDLEPILKEVNENCGQSADM